MAGPRAPTGEAAAALAAGTQAQQAGRRAEAEGHYRRAAILDPRAAEPLVRLGTLALQSGDARTAESELLRTLALEDGHVGARGNLAMALVAQGRAADAIPHWRRVAAARPKLVQAWRGLADACLAADRAAEAVEAYAKARALGAGDAALLAHQAQALAGTGRTAEALAAAEAALAQAPAMVEAHYAHAQALKALQRLDLAAAAYARALAIDQHFVPARFNLAVLEQERGHFDAALAHYDAILAADPDHARAHNNRGTILAERGESRAALEAYARAAAADPAYAEPHENRGNVYQEEGRVAEADAAYAEAERLGAHPGVRVKRATLLPVIAESAADIDAARARYTAGLDALERDPPALDDPLRQVGKTSFYLAYAGEDDRALQERLARIYARACPALLFRAPHIGRARARGRIRVGFLSRFLRDHTIGRLMEGTIRGLDRARFETAILAPAAPRDALAQSLATAVDRTVDLPADLFQAQRRIAEEELDALVFADIGMEPYSYFLGFARLARVQAAFWGHPDTTGLPEMDHFLSAVDLEAEGAEARYSETLVRFATLNTAYARPAVPDPLPTRTALGLPEDATLYVVAQTLFKVHPRFDAILAAVLAGDPKARIVLIKGNLDHWTETLRARLALALGSDAARVLFLDRLDRARFLALLARADVALDTTVFCGGNSTLETLAMGTPVVTLPTAHLRGRISAACYAKMGWTALVARDEADYVRVALALGTDKDFRRAARGEIARRSAVLYKDETVVREFEAYLEREIALRA